MAIKKYTNGSWVSASYRKYGTETDAITTLPATVIGDGTPISSYIIKGNMEQSGTPTPENPIMPSGCGERTENLFDGEIESGYYDNNGEKQSNPNWIRCKNLISADSNTTYHVIIDDPEGTTGGVVFARCYDARGEYIGTTSQTVIQYYKEYAFTTLNDTKFISFYISIAYIDAKIAIYQTTIQGKAYEPYGYKLPMVSRTENIMDVYSSYGNKVVNYSGVIFDFSKEPQCITINGQSSSMYPQVQIWGKNGALHFENGKTYTALIRTTNKPKNSNVYLLIQGLDAEGNWLTIKDVNSDMGDISFSVSKDYVNFRNIFVCQNTGITYDNMKAYFMFTEGSTAPDQYIPYYHEETPIYLGEVQTTRRIKKLVLTGEETIGTSGMYYITTVSIPANDRTDFVCSHFKTASYGGSIPINGMRFGQNLTSKYDTAFFNYDSGSGGAENFKTYLAAQYAAGTPVTIWYVLKEPETAVVNEPLMKIGDYVDSVSGTGLATSGTAQEFDVGTTLKPSEVDLTYHGWHEHEDTTFTT